LANQNGYDPNSVQDSIEHRERKPAVASKRDRPGKDAPAKVAAVGPIVNGTGNEKNTRKRQPEQVVDEEMVISNADAIADPGAVVVEASHTAIACRTVLRTDGTA